MNRLILAATILALASPALAQRATTGGGNQTVIRDAGGRTVGTATTNGNVTTFRDAGGRTTGTATTNGNQTVIRDAGGRNVGSATR